LRIILDPGSTHLNKWENIKSLIELAKEVGAESIKWQLFKLTETNTNQNNIEFPRELWHDTVEYCRKVGIDVFASVFDTEAVDMLIKEGITKVKLAYSQAFNLPLLKYIRDTDLEIWASGDQESFPHYADVKLFCVPEYPPKKEFFDYVPTDYFDARNFDGFSSHYIGLSEDFDILNQNVWKIIEKHFCLGLPEDNTPDSLFALNPKELRTWAKKMKEL